MHNSKGIWQMIVAMLLSGTIYLVVLANARSPQANTFFRCLSGAGTTTLVYLQQTKIVGTVIALIGVLMSIGLIHTALMYSTFQHLR